MDRREINYINLMDALLPRILIHMPKSPYGKNFSMARDAVFISALLWLADNQGRWDALPIEFGNKEVIYQRFNRWSRSGRLPRIFDIMNEIPEFPFFFDGKMIRPKVLGSIGLRLTRRYHRRIKARR